MNCSKAKAIRMILRVISAIMLILSIIATILSVVNDINIEHALIFLLLGQGIDNIVEIADQKEEIKELKNMLNN